MCIYNDMKSRKSCHMYAVCLLYLVSGSPGPGKCHLCFLFLLCVHTVKQDHRNVLYMYRNNCYFCDIACIFIAYGTKSKYIDGVKTSNM